MRTRLLICFVALALSSCGRSRSDREVEQLRQEVERLKAAQPSAEPSSIARTETSPDYSNFLREARRLLAGLESRMNYVAYHERVGEILASGVEAAKSVRDPQKRKLIVDFTNAVSDANDLWRYKIEHDSLALHIKRIDGTYIHGEPFYPCSERWDHQLDDLIKLYEIDQFHGDSIAMFGTGIDVDAALKDIFQFAAKTFHALDES